MDKYEYKLKLEQLKSLVEVKDYHTAAEIADSINWKKVRNANTLIMVAGVYENVERYQECQDVLLQAYEHASASRSIVSKLVDVAIKAKNPEDAEEFYSEFVELSPRDSLRYVYAYKIACLKNSAMSDRIAILEELKNREYTEVWAYELAALYGQAGMRDKCVETCDELVLWFGEGEYVEKALNLKRQFQPLTPAQERKYQALRRQRGLIDVDIPVRTEMKLSEESGLPEVEVNVSPSKFNTINLQEELAKNMRQIMDATDKKTVENTMESISKMVSEIPYLNGEQEIPGVADDPNALSRQQINDAVDESLREDFQVKLQEEAVAPAPVPEQKQAPEQIEGQMTIEDVLAEWEKTKRAAEAAMAAAEQRKLEMSKTSALAEAGEIMERLKALIPILQADPEENLPQEDTQAAAMFADKKVDEKYSGSDEAAIAFVPTGKPADMADVDVTVLDEDETPSGEIEEAAPVINPILEAEPEKTDGAPELLLPKSEQEEAEQAEKEALAKEIAEMMAAADYKPETSSEVPETETVETPEIAEEPEAEAEAEPETAEEPEAEAEAEPETAEEPEAEAEAEPETAEEPETEAEPEAEETPASGSELNDEEEAFLAEAMAGLSAEVVAAIPEDQAKELETELPKEDIVLPSMLPDEKEAEEEVIIKVADAEKVSEEVTTEEEPEVEEEETEAETAAQADAEEMDELERQMSLLADEIAADGPFAEETEEAEPETEVEAEPEIAEEPEETVETEEAEPEEAVETEEESEEEALIDELLTDDAGETFTGNLTEEQKELFSYFLPVPGMEEQIKKVLSVASTHIGNSLTSMQGNIVIIGEEGSGKTVFATSLIKAIQKLTGKEDKKIGKISAESLNRKDFATLVPKLDGGFLIVDKAGELSKDAVLRMSHVMEQNTRGLVVVLEDNNAGIRNALKQDYGFAKKFTEKVNIPIFTIDELVSFGESYAEEMECVLDEMGRLALYNRINNIQKHEHVTSLTEVKDIVDEAIESAEGGGLKKLFSKKYDENDFLILREKDFEPK